MTKSLTRSNREKIRMTESIEICMNTENPTILHEANPDHDSSEKLRVFQEQISHFSTDEKTNILRALDLTRQAHESQKRPDGPYWEHPLRVAGAVLAVSGNANLVTASLLHDIVEDQSVRLLEILSLPLDPKVSPEEQAVKAILNLFGARVAQLVSSLTNPDFGTILNEQGVDKKSPEYDEKYISLYVQHVKDIVQDPEAGLIKFLDFSENGLGISTFSEGNRKAWLIKKYRPLVDIFIEKINDPVAPLTVINKAETLERLHEAAHYMDAWPDK